MLCPQIGVSYNLNNVSIYVVDLKKVVPFGGPPSPNEVAFRHGASLRKSFNREKSLGSRQIKVHENQESDEKSSTETEDDAVSLADIKDLGNYHAIFQPRGRECESSGSTFSCFFLGVLFFSRPEGKS